MVYKVFSKWFRLFLVCIVTLVFAGPGLAAESSGSTRFNGKTVSYRFSGDSVEALSYTEGGTCRIKATVDGETHRIVISENRLQWNGASVPLNGFDNMIIKMNKTDATFVADGHVVDVKPM